MIDCTLVLGLDAKHLDQFRMVLETWWRHKPSLWRIPWVIFYDREQVEKRQVELVVHHGTMEAVPWPPKNVEYKRTEEGKWGDPQRYKMLAGFVHIPAAVVKTKYWLKVDVDTVATGMDDWIDGEWFKDNSAIVSHPWGYTKPADQMVKLDQWVDENKERMQVLAKEPPLELFPKPESGLLQHKRIISWCSFWRTAFTRICSYWANITCGNGKLPVPSQDGFLWYCAERMKLGIVRPDMKDRGWAHLSTTRGIQGAVREAMSRGWRWTDPSG